MSSFPLEEEFPGVLQKRRAAMTLQDQVAQLFEEARDDVYRYLLTLGIYPPQAQEATQEVFLRLYTALKKGEQIQNARAWIFRVAHNLGLKIRTRESARAPFEPDLESKLRAGASDPEQQVLDREQALRFHTAVQRLSEQQRRCLLLRLEGLRYPEIGSILGISPSAVGEFLRRAISRLKKDEI